MPSGLTTTVPWVAAEFAVTVSAVPLSLASSVVPFSVVPAATVPVSLRTVSPTEIVAVPVMTWPDASLTV